jgi:hypothetical protein
LSDTSRTRSHASTLIKSDERILPHPIFLEHVDLLPALSARLSLREHLRQTLAGAARAKDIWMIGNVYGGGDKLGGFRVGARDEEQSRHQDVKLEARRDEARDMCRGWDEDLAGLMSALLNILLGTGELPFQQGYSPSCRREVGLPCG